jgi:Chaperone of endosialidase
MAINLIRKANAEMPSTAFNPLTEEWVIGPNAGGVSHFVQGNALYLRTDSGASTASQLALLGGAAEAGSAYSFIQTSNGTADLYSLGISNEGNHLIIGARSSNSRNIYFVNGNPTRIRVGRIDTGGSWYVGPVSPSVNTLHFIDGYSDSAGGGGTLQVFNRATTLTASTVEVSKGANNNTTSNRLMVFSINNGVTASGQINANGAGAAAFGTFSDSRLKTNVVNLSGELAKIMSLRPVEFDYIAGGHQIGFIAQEMQGVYPDSVGGDEETDYLTITGWDRTSARLVKALQELKEEFDAYVAAHP